VNEQEAPDRPYIEASAFALGRFYRDVFMGMVERDGLSRREALQVLFVIAREMQSRAGPGQTDVKGREE
jgi:hypothetical protein